MSKHIILLGPRIKKTQNVGGVVILFEQFLDYCIKNKIPFYCIDTNLSNYKFKIVGIIQILIKFVLIINKSKYVSIHGTARDYFFLAPIIITISKLFNKKTSLRKFAGNFHEIFENSSIFKKNIIKFILTNSDINFFETKYLTQYFKHLNANTFWFPNSRHISKNKINFEFSKKFVFISQIKESKGIYEIISAASYFDDTYTFDFYGPILDKNFLSSIKNKKNICYKGQLKSSEVITALLNYNILLLPSIREGYPGIILEALSVGMPVIATNLTGISEIINDKQNGILIPPKNYNYLVNAIKFFDNSNFQTFCMNAAISFDNFNTEDVHEKFFKKLNSL